uniref:Macaca fascicularis brain cDNA, clone: QmoA-11635 n=1 Tax=Macaca fascicularis TaxID=9541 RepID=I7GN71_MACFA|nr:unnamed protein product [Macaca fascicularis]
MKSLILSHIIIVLAPLLFKIVLKVLIIKYSIRKYSGRKYPIYSSNQKTIGKF